MTAGARSPVSAIWEWALDLVFPPRCVSCRKYGAFVCETCSDGMERAEPPRCATCWHLVKPDVRCSDCAHLRPALDGARASFTYSGPARDAVLALKFAGVSAVSGVMGAAMADTLRYWEPSVAAIVPVPLAGRRLRLRGYNQSELLAREVSRATGIPLERGALVRRRATAPQSAQPDAGARRRNVAGAFGRGRSVPPRSVLLIDDVMTTGATVDACARVLKENGCERVFTLTFARED